MSKNRGPKIKKSPKKPKPATNPKTRSKKRQQPEKLIGPFMTQRDAENSARQRGISAQIVLNENRTFSLRKIG